MEKIYRRIIRSRKGILVFFAIAFIFCAMCSQLVEINYDIADYLPDGTKSTVSLELMESEFDGGIPNARVMVQNVSIPEALDYKARIQAVEGANSVTWLDDAVNITVPLSTLDKDTLETYYKNDSALFTVTIEEDHRITAVEEIRSIVGDSGALTGSAVSTADATTNTVAEVLKVTVITIVFVFVVLTLTTTAWVEPILILVGIGVSIMLNNGSNLLFGEISFVTNAAGSVLLLAVSLDYSVFLLHRFHECIERSSNPEEAMVEALTKSTPSVLSSGLTTVIGFLALVIMQFKIGPDLGLSLAKGVAISLITVFVFTPSLILCAYNLVQKTHHKQLLPTFTKLAGLIRKIAIPMTIFFVILIVPSYLASNSNDYLYGSTEIFTEGTQYGNDTVAIEEIYGQSDTLVLLVPKGDTATQSELSDALHAIPEITSIISYVDLAGAEIPSSYLDANTLSQLEGENYCRMVISADVPYEGEETFQLVEQVRDIAEQYYPGDNYLAGLGVSTYDLKETITADMTLVNLVAIVAVFVVLLLTLKSISLPLILVLSIETAIWLNLSVPYFMSKPIYYLAYLIISSIQLGATVDYAILMTDRYRENRATLSKDESIRKTWPDVFVSIMTSGSVLTVVGLLLGFMSSNQLLAQLGIFIGRGAIFSLIIVLFVLPGLLFLCDGIIAKTNTKRKVAHR